MRQIAGGRFVIILFAIAAYVLVQLAIAAYAARGTRTDADYLVAGRRLGVFAVAASLFATWFAAEGVMATAAEVAADGLAGARVDPFGYGFGILFLGLFVAAALRRGGHMTLADYVGARFGVAAEALTGLAIAVSGTIWAAAQLYALASVIAASSPLDFSTALAAATATVIVYTLVGGLIGDVATDIVQGAVLVLGLGLIFVMTIIAAGGVGAALEFAATPERLVFTKPGESLVDRIELLLIPIVGSVVAQEAVARALAARTPEIARRGAVYGSIVYIVIGLIPVFLGLVGPHLAGRLGVTLGEGDQFVSSLASALLPSWMYVAFSGALISAILSSVDSALLAVSAVGTESGYRRAFPAASERARLVAARAITVGAGLVAFLIAGSGDSLRGIVLTASSVGAIIAAPVILGVLGERFSPAGRGFGGPVAAVGGMLTQGALLVALDWTLGIEGAFLISLGAGFALFLAIAAFERPRGQAPAR